jgi:hypothetical protein
MLNDSLPTKTDVGNKLDLFQILEVVRLAAARLVLEKPPRRR